MSKTQIFAVLGIVIFLEIIGATYYLTRPLPLPQPVGMSEEVAGGAVLSLLPGSGQIKAGESVFVKINLDTGGLPTDGTRAVILFDPTKVKVEEINHKIAVYQNYPVQEINNEKGRVVINGIIDPKAEAFAGSGTVATLKIRALKPDTAILNFEFVPGQTTDSNVALHGAGEDILQKANGAVYSVMGE